MGTHDEVESSELQGCRFSLHGFFLAVPGPLSLQGQSGEPNENVSLRLKTEPSDTLVPQYFVCPEASL